MASLAAALRLRPTAPVQAALAGALGFVFAGLAAVTAWHLDSSREAELAHFGDTMARELAFLAAEPVLRQDSIGLGTLANRMAAFDEVRAITIHSIDDRLLAASGNTGGSDEGQVWVGAIRVEDTVAGHVRVVLEPSRFRPSLATTLGATWPAWLAAFLVTLPICYVLAREGRQEQAPQPIGSFLLVVNLFNRTVLTFERRAAVLDEGVKIAERVVGLYGGRAFEHAEAGILLAFDDTGQPDRAFEAVCGALLTQSLFEGMRRRAGTGREAPIFRYGLSVAPWYAGAEELAESAQTRDAILLSALAPSGELAIGNAAHRAIERPERLELAPLDTLATQTLSVTLAPCRIVRGAAGAYRTLLDEQARSVQRPLQPA